MGTISQLNNNRHAENIISRIMRRDSNRITKPILFENISPYYETILCKYWRA